MSFWVDAATNAAILLLVLLTVLAVTIGYVVLRTYLMHLHWRRQGLPCAPFIPLVGHTLRAAKYSREDRMMDIFRDRTALYGDLYSLTFGPVSRLSVNSPPHIADVLRVKADCYEKGYINRIFVGNIVGLENLLLTEGAEHAKHRRMINPAFHHQNLQGRYSLSLSLLSLSLLLSLVTALLLAEVPSRASSFACFVSFALYRHARADGAGDR